MVRNPEISIIVPVYKVEKYLVECLNSILSQSFKDFELLLVDDGSPDRCPQICDEYGLKDPRVVTFHKKTEAKPPLVIADSTMQKDAI